MAAGYDNAAWFYDCLSLLILGNAPVVSQNYFLENIPERSRVLIAGGGTGKIVEKLSSIHPGGLDIVYAELSPKMMARAKRRNARGNKIEFVQLPVQQLNVKPFNIIITPFVLDSIPPTQFHTVFSHLDSLLMPGGSWLNTDFQLTGKWWQKALLKAMYLFFHVMGCVDRDDLPLMEQTFVSTGYQLKQERLFYGDFIAARVWGK